MGVLPLQFKDGENSDSLGLTGKESFEILGIKEIVPQGELTVNAKSDDGQEKSFKVIARLDTPVDIEYYRNGGILHTVLRNILNESLS
jgi:aconitate hydratase